MRKEKLIKYSGKLQKQVEKLNTTKKPGKILSIYEKILTLVGKLKSIEGKGKVRIEPSSYKLEKKFSKEKKEVKNILEN
jgi:hypothetical protein